MVDRVGKNVLVGDFISGCNPWLSLPDGIHFLNPFVAMSIMGVSYSMLACALWPLVFFSCPEHQLGTAMDCNMQSIQNLRTGVISQWLGLLSTKRIFSIGSVFLCLAVCRVNYQHMLYLVDSAKRTGLNLSTYERRQLAAQSRVTLVSSEEEEIRKRDFGVSPMHSFAPQLNYGYAFYLVLDNSTFQLPETYRSSALAYPHVLK
ncbi:Major facilitator super domain-containing protein 1 [Desmophyllum pertusum]|uniref:Major facilitator super domain-containing protein 1 n=1 Tax=Desmophyllum pertusum TaxID=174260 RepID=A0A9X0CDA5_9CNID|nr:Major facilitator super domain-containing protein 1 [Desmophyllum pertusum]